jgi:hypothetical protein
MIIERGADWVRNCKTKYLFWACMVNKQTHRTERFVGRSLTASFRHFVLRPVAPVHAMGLLCRSHE